MTVDTNFCRGTIRGDFHRGTPCKFAAVKDGFCLRHHPDTLLPKAELRVERFKRQLRQARDELYQLRNFHA